MLEPRIARVPSYVTSAGDEAIALAAASGLHMDDWQAYLLREALGERADGRWASPEVGILVARQNGKGAWFEARALAGLFLFNEPLIVYSAHQFKTAQETFRRIKGMVEGTPHLSRRVKHVRTGSDGELIELKNGCRLRFIARSKNSGRGFSADTMLIDEAQELSDLEMSALVPTMSASPNAQIVYAGTVPGPLNNAEVFTQVRDRGRAGEDPRLAWFEWNVGEFVPDLDDRDAWRAANPAYDTRINDEFVQLERGAMSDEAFARERLSIWPSGVNAGLYGPAWNECLSATSQIATHLTLGIAVSIDQTHACIGVAGHTADGLLHLEVIDYRRGLDWVAPRVKELRDKHGAVGVVMDSVGPANKPALINALDAQGVRLTMPNTKEMAGACADVYDAVLAGKVRHLGQTDLDAAVLGATRRDMGDRWLYKRRYALFDVSPLEAVTLAAWGVDTTADYDLLASVW